ncbi:lytic polysaccharide monooxygenase [Streptomyces griseus]|uniref:lytic polysaccharide monooxygenase auxiliary activity family 9 protein n=1 Tax=Streptomyces griseus TaxID=1911 RepID=UPI00055D120A|nr:lytic polysaccharide monooxygenase [Streptomyces griseus]
MSASRKVAAVTVLGAVPLTLGTLAAGPAVAHGSMADPVSRVSQCYGEGPESPKSAACEAAVAVGGTQALYDWNGIRIGDANGRHQRLIPDGKLCSADTAEFKGLDLARADWPTTAVRKGSYTFKYRVTAPHKGTFKVYITKAGYDPARPPAWGDLDLAHPVATATDPVASGGFYTFSGTLPERSGKQLLYAVWQRSDSPEAFYSCSDVIFGGNSPAGSGSAPTSTASAPSEEQIEDGADKSTVEHGGHGDDDALTSTEPTPAATDTTDTTDATDATDATDMPGTADEPRAAVTHIGLAETGGDGSTPVALVGATVLALGSAVLFASVRRRGR